MNKVLIISDLKPGHFNQSIAFAKLKGLDYDVIELPKSNKLLKIFTYILDFFNIYINIFNLQVKPIYKAVISTGSSTYYTNRYLSKELNIKSIAIMLPKGFKYTGFDYIVAQEHDNPPRLDNIITISVNLSVNEPKGYIDKDKNEKYIGLIVGGDNKVFSISSEIIKASIDKIFKKYPTYKKLVTTSRRTPKVIEEVCDEYDFDYKLFYSVQPTINPIPDFIDICEVLYITSDSTSMISEAAAHSHASIEVIMLDSKVDNTKYHKLIDIVTQQDDKVDLKKYLEKIDI